METKDRISRLPEHILHHILCFLDQKKAVKTCVLSKSWRYLWCTRPKIYFHERLMFPGNRASFLSVLHRTLQGYADRNLRLEAFILRMSEVDGDADAALLLNNWIPILIRNMGVQRFELTFEPDYDNRRKSTQFQLPSFAFESESLREITLYGCSFKSTPRIRCKNLHTLCLSNVYIPEKILDNMLSYCPSIDRVFLSSCTGINFLELQELTNLKHFHFGGDYSGDNDNDVITEIEIGGGNIQTLATFGISHCFFSVDYNQPQLYFPHLTSLMMRDVELSSELFSCSIPRLEELRIDGCNGIKELNITSGRSVKRLDIRNKNRPFKVTVDAPSIVSFLYEGILPQSVSFSALTTTSDDCKSNIMLSSSSGPSDCFNVLNGMLTALSQSEISLELDQIQIRWFCNQLQIKEYGVSDAKLPVVVEHLTLKSPEKNKHSSAAYFLNRLFHMFRPSFIRMDINFLTISKTELELIIELLLKERETVQCYFWQSVLEEVSLQVSHRNQSEWQPVEYASFPELSKKFAAREHELLIHLKWRK